MFLEILELEFIFIGLVFVQDVVLNFEDCSAFGLVGILIDYFLFPHDRVFLGGGNEMSSRHLDNSQMEMGFRVDDMDDNRPLFKVVLKRLQIFHMHLVPKDKLAIILLLSLQFSQQIDVLHFTLSQLERR